MLCRSYLFVPGNRPDRFAKATSSNADAVVIDLEDAVTAVDKDVARQNAARWLGSGRQAVVRVNAATTQWFDADLDMCRRSGALAVMLPKSESPALVHHAHQRSGAVVLPLIETAQGMAQARAVAATQGVQRLVFGSLDFQLDMGMEADEDALLVFRSELVLASRLAGIASPIDGVTVDLSGASRVRLDALRAGRLGFGAKLCIHPAQVGPVNEAFSPSPGQVKHARAVISAMDAAAGSAVSLGGEMVDLPVVLRAHRLLGRTGSQRSISYMGQNPYFRRMPV